VAAFSFVLTGERIVLHDAGGPAAAAAAGGVTFHRCCLADCATRPPAAMLKVRSHSRQQLISALNFNNSGTFQLRGMEAFVFVCAVSGRILHYYAEHYIKYDGWMKSYIKRHQRTNITLIIFL